MALGDEESEQRRLFAESLRYADASIEELWLRYFTIGGHAGQFEVEAYIHGAMALPALQRDILAHALNERLDELYSDAPRAPYSADAPDETLGESSGDETSDESGDGSERQPDGG